MYNIKGASMKKILLALLISLLSALNLFSQGNWEIKGGATYSNFRTVESQNNNGFTLGFGHEWSLIKIFSIGWEFFYNQKGAILRDKIIGNEYVKFVYKRDILTAIAFLESPILLKYNILLNKQTKLQLLTGLSLAIGIKDNTKVKNQRFLFEVKDPKEWEKLYYDYDFNIDPDGPLPHIARSSGFVFTTGIAIQWRFLAMEMRYGYDLYDVETVVSYDLYEKLHSLSLLFSYKF